MEKGAYQKPNIQTVEDLSGQLLLANRRLEEVNEKLKASERARSEMLANISHDLRAPATALRSAVDTLLASEDMPAQDRRMLLEIMDRRTATLEHLISELHFLIALDLPSFELHCIEVEAAPFLEEYFVTQRLDSKYAQRTLHCEVPADFEGTLLIDPEQMVRVLDNLFSNAVRFSRPGDQITLGCCRAHAGGRQRPWPFHCARAHSKARRARVV